MSRGTPATDAYLDLKTRAKRDSRTTQELLQLYLLEGFLARLAASELREAFVLKGGVLLAAFDARRPTRDVDLAGTQIANDPATVLEEIRTVLDVDLDEDDGIEFDAGGAVADAIREDDEYSGVRVTANAALATARLSFHVDVNVGDPIWPAPVAVAVPRLRGGPAIQLTGYPLHMVHAEKMVTAIQRGIANTRWRDFGDIWTLSRRHQVTADNLTRAIQEVATYRKVTLEPLADILDGYADLAQGRWSAWRRRSNSDHLPEEFAEVLTAVINFADPVLSGGVSASNWDANETGWRAT
jgi:hypothetical protein